MSVTYIPHAGVIGRCYHTWILCVLGIPTQVFMIFSNRNSQQLLYPVSHLPSPIPALFYFVLTANYPFHHRQGLKVSYPAWLAFSCKCSYITENDFSDCHINQFLELLVSSVSNVWTTLWYFSSSLRIYLSWLPVSSARREVL